MAHLSFNLQSQPILYIGETWLVRKMQGMEWNHLLWHCRNIYDWSQRRYQGKRHALMATEEGALMTTAQLHNRCKVTNLEWLMNWPWERITGRVQFPGPVQLDENITMSADVRNLRDTYLGMQVLCPNIKEAGFRWEQVDGWDIAIQFRENPEVLIGGSRAKFNPGVSGCVGFFSISLKEFLGCLILAVCASILIIQLVQKTIAMDKAGEQGSDLMWMVIGAGIIAVFGFACESLVAVHKGILLTDRVI